MPGLHILDLAGPAQVFSSTSDLGHSYDLQYVSDDERVPTAQGLLTTASTTWPELDRHDLVLVPGWRPNAAMTYRLSTELTIRIRCHHENGGTVASVCAGAFALGRAGLLDGRRCTTHHTLQDRLAAAHPTAHVVRDVLFTEDDRVVTSAGIASGIDLALHLVASRHGVDVAARVARGMVVYARRNGDEPQASVMLRHRAHLSDSVHQVQDIIDSRYAEPLRLSDLAATSGISERTLTRQFVKVTGLTPLRYQQALRVERAEHLIGHGSTVEAAARAVGLGDARMLRRLRTRAKAHLPDPDADTASRTSGHARRS